MKITDKGWRQVALQDAVIMVQPDIPDWVVVTRDAADLLCGESVGNTDSYRMRMLENALAVESAQPYAGRQPLLKLDKLKECWFHITDRCNLSCGHCLFSASPEKRTSIDPQVLQNAMNEALALGCRLFYFTGGEPFLYRGFVPMLQKFLDENQDCHCAVLTNGMLLGHYLEELRPMARLHLQLSLDGLEQSHDRLRGRGSYRKLMQNIKGLREAQIPFTVSVAVSRENIDDLPALVDLAAEAGASSIHLLYHFVRGKGSVEQFLTVDEIFPRLLEAYHRAVEQGLKIDNIETIRSQVFSTPATRYDLSNTAWESVAVGPDGVIYPSPALVGMADCRCGTLSAGLEEVWKNSSLLQKIRGSSLIDSPAWNENPFKFIVGGGDVDHSFLAGGRWVGHDPYVELYNRIAVQLIAEQASLYEVHGKLGIILRMGDVRYDCPDGNGADIEVSLTHCNCLISLASDIGHSSVREFYGKAALASNEDILNPLAPAQGEAEFVPEAARSHSYGCGSPVTDGAPKEGETLVDLGSGGGIECFMASKAVGSSGKVYGIDMTDEMLRLANESRLEVAERLGYGNVEFKKGFLEDIPLADNLADVVISNCVINLSPDKRKTYQEIHRILRPGGRLVVSDIVTDEAIPPGIRNNVKYRGECLGGAMQQEELVAMMEGAGFAAIRFVKRFPYRQVDGMDFFSLTYEAIKPVVSETGLVKVIYRGPHSAIYTHDGTMLVKGKVTEITALEADLLADSVFVLGQDGEVVNLVMTNSCCTPQTEIESMASCCGEQDTDTEISGERRRAGCMVCGEELLYFTDIMKFSCSYCGREQSANGCCENGHFVCDTCHSKSGLEVIRGICKWIRETDLIALLKMVRSHPAIPMHGPEHHAMIPGIILAAYRNGGGGISDHHIETGIKRGAEVPGGACGFWGACGAAIGTGIAISTILGATPVTPGSRQTAQWFSAQILAEIAKYRGGRCCQRETWLALRKTAELSSELLSVQLTADDILACDQYLKNRECIRKMCPLWKCRVRGLRADKQIVVL